MPQLAPAPPTTAVVSPRPASPAPPLVPTDRMAGWLTTATIGLLALVLRLPGLGSPTDAGTPIFDEKHYVPQAWQMLGNGFVEDNPGYGLVVHPPLSKQLMALGEWVLGYTPWGWRVTSALAGTLVVVLVVRLGRRVTRSTILGGLAGLLLALDPLSIVTARVGMIDVYLVLFVVAAAACLAVDYDDAAARLSSAWWASMIAVEPTYGPRLGVRWWRIGAGVCLGLATATKWSGAYYVLACGALALACDALLRRQYGVRRPWAGAVRRDLGPAVLTLGILPLAIYLGSWWAWLRSEVGVFRHEAPLTGTAWGWIPEPLQGLGYYTLKVLSFHEELTNSSGHIHPWESKPWTWPLTLRPLLYYHSSGPEVTGCSAESSDGCVRAVLLFGTPVLWWAVVVALLWCGWRCVAHRDRAAGAIVVLWLAGWLPWFANLDRQMYLFYAAPLIPCGCLALALILGRCARWAPSIRGRRRRVGIGIVSIYLGALVGMTVWYLPIVYGWPLTEGQWHLRLWLPSWH